MKVEKSIKFHVAIKHPDYSWFECGVKKQQEVPDAEEASASRALFNNVLKDVITDSIQTLEELKLVPQQTLLTEIQKNLHLVANNMAHQTVEFDVSKALNGSAAHPNGLPTVPTTVPMPQVQTTATANQGTTTVPFPPGLIPATIPLSVPTIPIMPVVPPTLNSIGTAQQSPIMNQTPAQGQIVFPTNELYSPE